MVAADARQCESTRWWLAACTNRYFPPVTPTERFRGRRMESCPATDKEWHRMRTGTGPQGAIKRELFSDKESLWGYSISHCSPQIEEMITQGEFTGSVVMSCLHNRD